LDLSNIFVASFCLSMSWLINSLTLYLNFDVKNVGKICVKLAENMIVESVLKAENYTIWSFPENCFCQNMGVWIMLYCLFGLGLFMCIFCMLACLKLQKPWVNFIICAVFHTQIFWHSTSFSRRILCPTLPVFSTSSYT